AHQGKPVVVALAYKRPQRLFGKVLGQDVEFLRCSLSRAHGSQLGLVTGKAVTTPRSERAHGLFRVIDHHRVELDPLTAEPISQVQLSGCARLYANSGPIELFGTFHPQIL